VAKSKGNRLPPFVALIWEMLNSKAYKDLPPSSAKALPYFLGKVKTSSDPQKYNLEFSFSYREAEKLSFAPATFSKVIQNLVAFGFIDPVDKGGLRGECKSLNMFRLSKRWKDFKTQDFKPANWKCFLPKPRLKATSKSEIYSFKKGNEMASKDKSISHFEAVEVF
jgi:hypothetical protein